MTAIETWYFLGRGCSRQANYQVNQHSVLRDMPKGEDEPKKKELPMTKERTI